MRHIRSPNRRLSAAISATAKLAHMALTPKAENGVGDVNSKGIDHVRRTGDPQASDVDHHRHDQRASDPLMCTPPSISRQPR